MTSIVYPYLHQLSQGEELKYSIRSICKYAKFDFDIVIVGDKPEWYNGNHIKTIPIRNKKFTRAFDIARKIEMICNSLIITDDFMYCYDDQYFISPVELSDLSGAIAMSEITQAKQGRVGSETWKELLTSTYNALKPNGTERVYNYETHLPRILNKAKLKIILDAYDLHRQPLLFNTLYFNEYFDSPRIELEKNNPIKAGIYKQLTVEGIRSLCMNKLVLNNGEKGYNNSLKLFLKNSFPEKCKFEI